MLQSAAAPLAARVGATACTIRVAWFTMINDASAMLILAMLTADVFARSVYTEMLSGPAA